MNFKQDILEKTFSLVEMAVSDMAGINFKKDTPERIATVYIKNAKNRALNKERILAGLGSTFSAIVKDGTITPEQARSIKAEIKQQLGTTVTREKLDKPTKATVTKKAKEDTVYKGTEKVKAAAKRASEVMKEDIFKNAGVQEEYNRDGTGPHGKGKGPGKGKGCEKKNDDVYMSKDTDSLTKEVEDIMIDDYGFVDGKDVTEKIVKALQKDKKFSSLKGMRREQAIWLEMQKHEIVDPEDVSESILACKYCGERHNSKEALEKHQKMCQS